MYDGEKHSLSTASSQTPYHQVKRRCYHFITDSSGSRTLWVSELPGSKETGCSTGYLLHFQGSRLRWGLRVPAVYISNDFPRDAEAAEPRVTPQHRQGSMDTANQEWTQSSPKDWGGASAHGEILRVTGRTQRNVWVSVWFKGHFLLHLNLLPWSISFQ